MKKVFYIVSSIMLPAVALAQGVNVSNLNGSISSLSGVVGKLVGFLIGAAVLVFLWGVLKYVFLSQGDPEKRSEGRGFMIWGIIALVVMTSVWGLVNLVKSTAGINGGGGPEIPVIPR